MSIAPPIAFKHANLAGTSTHGGVLVLAGDDHGCQSSTTAHQSEQVLIAAMIPVLNPATVQDYLDLGLAGFALSRFAGCWVGFKAVAEAVESSATVDVDPARVQIVLPTDFALPQGGLGIRWPDPPLEQEARLHGPKMAAVHAFARANRLDRVVLDAPQARLGIVTTGKAYLDVRQALDDLRLDDVEAARLGLRVYKVGLSWPLEPSGLRAFAEGLTDILVVEEKRALVEDQVMKALYASPARPRVHGKRSVDGVDLLPSAGELTPADVARAIVLCLERTHGPLPALQERLATIGADASRRRNARRVSAAHAVLLLGLSRTTPPPACPKAAVRSAASDATRSRCTCRARRRPTATWAAKAPRGSARHRISRASTCSRTSATARTSTAGCSRCARPQPPAWTSPTSCCSTMPWR